MYITSHTTFSYPPGLLDASDNNSLSVRYGEIKQPMIIPFITSLLKPLSFDLFTSLFNVLVRMSSTRLAPFSSSAQR